MASISSGTDHTWIGQCTCLDCIAHDSLAVLDNEEKVGGLESKPQGLRANTASNIDNQGALGEVFPSVPCQLDILKSDSALRKAAQRG